MNHLHRLTRQKLDKEKPQVNNWRGWAEIQSDNQMNRTRATKFAVLAAVTVGVVANAQIYSSTTATDTNPQEKFGDISITQTKVGNVTPANFVTFVPLSTPEISTTGLAASSALGLFALCRFIYRKK